MELTRRLWAVIGLAAGLAAFAVVLDRPLALAGTILVGVWLLSRQYLFYREVTALSDEISITQQSAKTGIRTTESVPTTLTVSLDTPKRLTGTVTGGLPVPASPLQPLTLQIGPSQREATITADVRWPVAGQHTFEEATVTVTDGLFREQFSAGTTPTVTVEPRGPRNLHVGEGGDRIATAYGEHDAGRLGSGLEPAELREYVPGDTADRIDWNATARLGTPYVREFDAETDRKTVLVVDHRHSLAEGPPEETKLDYLRELALALADSARRLGDPLGLVAIGDEGITDRFTPSTQPAQYTTIRRTLLELEPTASPQTGRNGHAKPTATQIRRQTKSLADVRHTLAALDGDDDEFARRLRPFYADRQIYLDRVSADPLYRAVQTTLARERGTMLTVICTDDASPTELLETVKLATRGGGTVLVFLAPTILYERGGLSDVQQAYDEYLEFEQFRRELARLDRVTALEVGPGDRLSAVLGAGRNRSGRTSVGGETP